MVHFYTLEVATLKCDKNENFHSVISYSFLGYTQADPKATVTEV